MPLFTLPARFMAVPISSDICLAQRERIVNVPPGISESRRLFVRRTNRVEAEGTVRHRQATGAGDGMLP
ncbi:MAG: hypothetical protein PUD20_02585 [bacterium]|nr:hypothetical protein [bacterium]